MGKNAKLRTLCEPLLATLCEAVAGEEPASRYSGKPSTRPSWSHKRRVLMQADIA